MCIDVTRKMAFEKIEREWDKHTDIATYRLNWPSGEFSENCQYNQTNQKNC